jgi:hypothetical protein
MRPTPIHEIARRIKPMQPFQQLCTVRGHLSREPKRGIRRKELEALLQEIMTKQLKREAKVQ